MMDFVNVSVRLRPNITPNTSTTNALQIISKNPDVLFVLDRSQTYHFDNIFSEDTDQEQVFNKTVKPLVNFVKQGYNCTVFAYGQTGAGKTFTMGTNPNISHPDDVGIISRALEEFFNPDYDTYNEVDVSVSFIEIYNEKVFDLAQNFNLTTPLQVKGCKVQGFTEKVVRDPFEAKELLQIGNRNRHTAGTKQNANSSRSHAIFTIHYRAKYEDRETYSKLNFVDLAGSESVKKTGNQGSTFHEGVNINKGLLCVGQVISALSKNSSYIPYRSSIITTILQDSLNRHNFVSLIACVSPNSEDLLETIQTLEFAHCAKKMRNKPRVNEIIMQYKNDNPALFNRIHLPTPSKKQLFMTPSVKAKRPPLNIIQETPVNSTALDNSPKSLMSMSFSTISNDITQASLSPVIRKYMTAMESSLMSKMETVITNTLKRPTRQSILQKEKENENTPNSTWNKIHNEVKKLVRSEIMQFSTARHTSSPIEEANREEIDNARKLLHYDSSPEISSAFTEIPENANLNENLVEGEGVFKLPKLPISKKKKKRLSTISPIESQTVRRSVRLSMKRQNDDSAMDVTFTDNNASIMKDDSSFNIESNIDRRRSVRLAQKSIKTPKIRKQNLKSTQRKSSPLSSHLKTVLNILNNGKVRELEKLQLVGTKTAQQILLYRKLKGKFDSIEDLKNVPGWGEKKFNTFAERNFLL